MKLHSILFAAAATGAAALSVGLAAGPAVAAQTSEVVVTGRSIEEAPTALVRYADLNLASDAGRARLERRIDFAAEQLCGKRHTKNVADYQEIGDCQSVVHASAKPQKQALFAAAENGQRLALGDVGAMTLSAE